MLRRFRQASVLLPAPPCRPIFDQKRRRNGQLDVEVRRALQWWCHILKVGLSELRPWQLPSSPPAQLFCDARGYPPHLGAVLLVDGGWWFSHCAAPEVLMKKFQRRGDNQIMGLELLSISLGLWSFQNLLQGRKVVVHSDNTGAEVSRLDPCRFLQLQCFTCWQASVARGSARSWDHAQLVHHQWTQAAKVSRRCCIACFQHTAGFCRNAYIYTL